MITRFASLSGRLLVAFAILFTVAACGGGGGGGGGSFLPDDDKSGTYYLTLKLLDASGTETNTVTSASPSTLQVTVTKNGKNGAPVANVVVSAAASAGVISPASGTALSDGSGVAVFRLGADAAKGAGTITATADAPAGTATATLNFQIGSPGLRLGYIDNDGLFIENEIGIDPDSLLASQAIAQLSLVILDENGDLASSAETVTFSSGCLSSGQAALDPANPLISGDGKVNTSYIAQGCSGNDQITASLEGSTSQAFGTISVASAQANGFTFVDAVPATIVLRGTGGGSGERSESSTVTFRVVDSNNAPIGGIKVEFALTTYVGGLKVSPPSAVSASDGQVTVNVFSGDVPTVVRVIAKATAGDGSGQQVSSVSDVLTVSTGLPDQNSFSVSVLGGFGVVDGMTMDGIKKTITVRMADTYNNPVPNGTAAIFTTEYGAIEPQCTTVDGACSVTWTSQDPRFPTLGDSEVGTIGTQANPTPGYNCPSLNTNFGPCPDSLGYLFQGGRSTVLVTAIGQESFVDRNGNGIVDEAEKDLFANLPEAFIDNNEDNIFNPATTTCKGAGADSPQCISGQEEIFVDFNNNGRYDKNNNPAVYNGLLCPPEGDGVWCSRSLVNVRGSAVLTLYGDDAADLAVELYRGKSRVTGTSWSGGEYTAYISDQYNNRPSSSNTVTITGANGCTINPPISSMAIPETQAPGAFGVSFSTGGQESQACTTTKASFTIKVGDFSKSFNCALQPLPADPNDPC